MKRKIMAAALSAAALPAMFTAVAAAGPASADCSASTFCLYTTHGYAGTEYRFHPSSSCTALTGNANNNGNAMRNYNGFYVEMWDLPNCAGSTHYTAQPNSYDSDFGNNGFSNKASSLKRV